MSNTKKRLLEYLCSKGISKSTFYKETGLCRGFLSDKKLAMIISGEDLIKIIAHYPDLNPLWLASGVGKMQQEQHTNLAHTLSQHLVGNHGINIHGSDASIKVFHGASENVSLESPYQLELKLQKLEMENHHLKSRVKKLNGRLERLLHVCIEGAKAALFCSSGVFLI